MTLKTCCLSLGCVCENANPENSAGNAALSTPFRADQHQVNQTCGVFGQSRIPQSRAIVHALADNKTHIHRSNYHWERSVLRESHWDDSVTTKCRTGDLSLYVKPMGPRKWSSSGVQFSISSWGSSIRWGLDEERSQ
jgi:hypothetical protein